MRLFISHKSEDKKSAVYIKQRLLEAGYEEKDLFLDSDEDSGIPAGSKWQPFLFKQIKQCRALLVLYSSKWRASPWCFAEFVVATMECRPIFPIILSGENYSMGENEYQPVFLDGGESEILKLVKSLDGAGLGPGSWSNLDPSVDCPFPGLVPFDEGLAAVYFGREPEVQEVKKRLLRMRSLLSHRMLLIGGASGSGKSSLLRAGLVPRLRRARDTWLVLPILRSGNRVDERNRPLKKLVRSIDKVAAEVGVELERGWSSRILEPTRVEDSREAFFSTIEKLAFSRGASGVTVVLPIDQFEELLAAGEPGDAFLTLLSSVCKVETQLFLVVATIRSDFLPAYERHSASLRSDDRDIYYLAPLPRERIRTLIEGPASLFGVQFAPDLVETLVDLFHNSESLPLLAYTLEKLFRRFSSDGKVELQDYETIGGVEGTIKETIDRIVSGPSRNSNLKVLRPCFLHYLLRVGKDDRILRCSAKWSCFPRAAQPLLKKFVDERLLSRNGDFVEVAHEALFQCWDELSTWISDALDELKLRRDVERAAEEWTRSGDAALLWSGRRLRLAKSLSVEPATTVLNFLKASRRRVFGRWVGLVAIAGLATSLPIAYYLLSSVAYWKHIPLGRGDGDIAPIHAEIREDRLIVAQLFRRPGPQGFRHYVQLFDVKLDDTKDEVQSEVSKEKFLNGNSPGFRPMLWSTDESLPEREKGRGSAVGLDLEGRELVGTVFRGDPSPGVTIYAQGLSRTRREEDEESGNPDPWDITPERLAWSPATVVVVEVNGRLNRSILRGATLPMRAVDFRVSTRGVAVVYDEKEGLFLGFPAVSKGHDGGLWHSGDNGKTWSRVVKVRPDVEEGKYSGATVGAKGHPSFRAVNSLWLEGGYLWIAEHFYERVEQGSVLPYTAEVTALNLSTGEAEEGENLPPGSTASTFEFCGSWHGRRVIRVDQRMYIQSETPRWRYLKYLAGRRTRKFI